LVIVWPTAPAGIDAAPAVTLTLPMIGMKIIECPAWDIFDPDQAFVREEAYCDVKSFGDGDRS
jgi:hypothetical protein